MRNLTDDEKKKKLMADMMKSLDDDFVDVLKNGNWGPSPISTYVSNPIPQPMNVPMPYGGISPTDIDARGVYGYQEPEKDEQGTYYGYKVLHKCTNFGCGQSGGLISPRYQEHWTENGELQADMVPAENHMHGIHFTKRPNHPELRQYMGRFHGAAYSASWYEGSQASSVLVKCALSGTIVETEQGFRAEHAQIVGVFVNGNWQSYQDYQERTRAYTRPNPIYEDEKENVWKARYRTNWGTMQPPTYWDTSSDADS